MTVSTVASIAAGISRTLNKQNSSVASSVQSLVSGTNSGIDVSSLTLANTLQSQVASLRAATQNLAQTSALVNVADSGVTEIAKALARLRDLSQQASSDSLSSEQRAALDAEFQSLKATINNIAGTTSFDGQNLLDGSFNSQALQLTGGGDEAFSIADLTTQSLFGGSDNTNLLSADNAKQASAVIDQAQSTVSDQQSTLGQLSQGIEYAFASLQTASQNQDAAASVLSDTDFAEASTASQQAQVQAQATSALLAQTNKLPNSLLSLLAE